MSAAEPPVMKAPMEYKDYYKTLGIERDASQEDVKRAYRKLARKYHPDVSKEKNAEARFKEINEGYEVLGDEEKRKVYDQLGSQWGQGQEFHPPSGGEPHVQRGFSEEEMGDFSDLFAEMFSRAQAGRGGGEPRNFRMRGQDLNASIEITLDEAYHGATRTLLLQVPDFDGQGHMHQRPRELRVKIPRGVYEGQQIRLSGQGGPGIGGGKAGDLFLHVTLAPHPLFQAERRDIFLKLPITPWEAALGGRIQTPTLDGTVELTIPPGSQSGNKMRLKGRGLPGKPNGDQYVVLHMVTPPANSDKSRAFYQKMADEMPFDPRQAKGI